MTDYYKTNKETLQKVQEKASKYDCLINNINKGIKRYKTLQQTTQNEDHKLAYSMLADYLEELKEEV